MSNDPRCAHSVARILSTSSEEVDPGSEISTANSGENRHDASAPGFVRLRKAMIERFFDRLKHFRAIATRYDKLARNFLAGAQLAAVTILLN